MSESFYRLLKPFIWPRYYEEGPPRYIDMAFLSKDFLDSEGRVREPVKSILDLVIIGYRPITSLSILAVLVENQNKPMYGTQVGALLEKRFDLPKGWFTKTRYYDTRIGKLLKILQRQSILEEARIKDIRTNKEYVGYRIPENIYPSVKERMLTFIRGEGLTIFAPTKRSNFPTIKTAGSPKHCTKCSFLTSSLSARYCELCSTPLTMNCPGCGKEMGLEYSFCLNCGKKLDWQAEV